VRYAQGRQGAQALRRANNNQRRQDRGAPTLSVPPLKTSRHGAKVGRAPRLQVNIANKQQVNKRARADFLRRDCELSSLARGSSARCKPPPPKGSDPANGRPNRRMAFPRQGVDRVQSRKTAYAERVDDLGKISRRGGPRMGPGPGSGKSLPPGGDRARRRRSEGRPHQLTYCPLDARGHSSAPGVHRYPPVGNGTTRTARKFYVYYEVDNPLTRAGPFLDLALLLAVVWVQRGADRSAAPWS